MTYARVLSRNNLLGDYGEEVVPGFSKRENDDLAMIGGDLRRLEMDARDARHLAEWAAISGATEDQCKRLLDAFFKLAAERRRGT